MAKIASPFPDSVPVLSTGKHRNPKRGACFMEMASYLAGERWSDHPACTHPLLADVARRVNDLSSEAGRRALAPLIPLVIGRVGDGPRVDVRIAWHCATTALPIASAERQRVLALAVLTSSQMLADPRLAEPTEWVLAQVPDATRWARATITRAAPRGSLETFSRHGAPVTVRTAVQGIAEACIPDVDGRLRQLLLDVIAECSTAGRHSSHAAASRSFDVTSDPR